MSIFSLATVMQLCCFCGKDKLRCICKKTGERFDRAGREAVALCENQLTMMGFDASMAKRAAELTGGNATEASELILSHTEVKRPSSPPRISASIPPVKSSTSRSVIVSAPAFSPHIPARSSAQSLPSSKSAAVPSAASDRQQTPAVPATAHVSSAFPSSLSSPRTAAASPPLPPPPAPPALPTAAASSPELPPYNPAYSGVGVAAPTLPRVSPLALPSHSMQPPLSLPSQASTAQPSASFVSMSDSPSSRHTGMVTASASAVSSPSHSSSYQEAQQVSISSSSSSSSFNSKSLPSEGFTAPDVVSRLSPTDDAMDSDNEVSLMSWQGDTEEEDEQEDEEEEPGAAAAAGGADTPERLQLRGIVIHVDQEQQEAVLAKIREDDAIDAAAAAAAAAMSSLPSMERPAVSPPARSISAASAASSSPSVSSQASTVVSRTSSVPASPYHYLAPPLSASQSTAQFEALAAWLSPQLFHPPMHVDCQDGMGKWLSARLIRLHSDYSPESPAATTFCNCKAHYDGWESRWDEEIDLLQQPQRIRRFGQRSQPPVGYVQPHWTRAGSRVVVWLAKQGKAAAVKGGGQWSEGRIQKVEGHQALVSFTSGSERDGNKRSQRWYELDSDCILSLDELERREEEERLARRAEERAAAVAVENMRRLRDQQQRRHRIADDSMSQYRKEMALKAKAQQTVRRSGSAHRYSEPLASTAGLPGPPLSPYMQVKREPPTARSVPPLSSLGSIPLRSTSSFSASSPTAASVLLHLKKAASAPPLPISSPSSPSSAFSSSSSPTWWQGQFLEAKDTEDKWLPAEVMQVDAAAQQLYIHYEGWSNRWDEWIHFTSPRLRPLGSTLRDSREERQRKRHERLFRSLLSSLPFELHTESKDGNCLFRAFAHQLWGDASLHPRVRAQCCDYIEREGQYYGKFVTDDEGVAGYVRRKRKGEEWGDHVEIEAMKELYDVNVVVYTQAWKDKPGKSRAAAATVKAEGERKDWANGAEEAGGGVKAEDREEDDEEAGDMVLDFTGEQLSGVRGTVRLSYHGRNHYNSLLDAAHPPPILRRGEEGRGDGKWKQTRLETERKEQAAMESALKAAVKSENVKEEEEMKDGFSISRAPREGEAGGAAAGAEGGLSMSVSAAKVLHEKQLILMGHAPYAE